MGILPSIPALNQPSPRYLAHSIVFSNFSPRTEMAERVPMEPRKSVFLTAVVSGASAAIGQAPVERLFIGFSGEHLCFNVLVTNRQIPARAPVKPLAEHIVIILRKFAVGAQANLRAHPRKIKQAPGLFITTFDPFDFH